MMRILWQSRSPISDGGLPGFLWRGGRLLKSAGWFALAVLFISVGVFKVLVEFFRLLEGTWFWGREMVGRHHSDRYGSLW